MSSSKNKPVEILGEPIDRDNMPKLYDWYLRNPETLTKQIKSLADKWHNGSVRAALISLESDLEHG